MASVSWTKDAFDDVDLIGRYIGADVAAPAAVFIQSIYSAVDRLETFPRSGRLVPGTRREVREIIVGSYRIIYLIDDDEVFILAVRHGSRPLYPSELER